MKKYPGAVYTAKIKPEDLAKHYPPPITNADRIRSMTDEELASYLYHVWWIAAWCKGGCSGDESCEPCWLNWLKQEVKE